MKTFRAAALASILGLIFVSPAAYGGAYVDEATCFGGTVPSVPSGTPGFATVNARNGIFSVTAWREPCQSDSSQYVLVLKLQAVTGSPSVGGLTVWQAGLGYNNNLLVKNPNATLLIDYGLFGSFGSVNVIFKQYGTQFDAGSKLDLRFSDSASTLGYTSLTLAPMPSRPSTASTDVFYGNLTDMWWSPAENGTGISIVQHGTNQLFAIWYTYADSGEPLWIVFPGGAWQDGKTFVGSLYKTHGTGFSQPWSQGAYQVGNAVGTGQLAFTSADGVTFSYSVNGVSGSRIYTRLRY